MERVKGIEPSSQAWEAHVLPLNHTRIEGIGFLPDVCPLRNREECFPALGRFFTTIPLELALLASP